MFLLKRTSSKKLKKFPAHDVNRIKKAIQKLPAFPMGMDVKKIVGTKNIYRVRVGNYRILIELEIHTLKVFSVIQRKSAYK
ncbi:MAG: Toxin RelE3 [ANME-2 cluster archaeon]|nr:Toxin RelE3 [ANME-2 cluster archaeon]